jgi:amino-acid N-acetyltransferase
VLRAELLLPARGLTRMPSLMLRAGTGRDASHIHALLERSGLPTSDLDAAQPRFIVLCEGAQIIGAGALQPFGSIALLRSVAVEPQRRGSGLGRMIVQELERRACASDIAQLVLLTQTATRFFEHQGYRVIDRQQVPQAVQGSEEFRSLCPASATCMVKMLAAPS